MRRIRVIQMVERLEIGGLEQVIATLGVHLDPHRFQPEIWCLAGAGPIAERLRAAGLPVRVLGIDNYHRPTALWRLIRLFRDEAPEIVHTHGYFAGVIGRLAAKGAGVPVVLHHVHSAYWNYHRRHRLMERLLAGVTDTILCCSQAVAAYVREAEGVPPGKLAVVYNGIDPCPASPPDLPALRCALGLLADQPVVMTVASLTPHKGHTHLLAAAAVVLAERPETRFLLVGGGPLLAELKGQCQRLGIAEQVRFAGIRSDARALLGLASCFALPSSEREGLGIAILEAMAAGLAAVGTRVGGIVEVIEEGESGFLVPPCAPEPLAEAILALLGDQERRQRMGQRGRAIFDQRFQTATMIAEVTRLYEKALSSKGLG